MHIPQTIAQVQRLPGLVAGVNNVPQTVVTHILRQWEVDHSAPPVMPQLSKPVPGIPVVVPFMAVDVSTVQVGGILLPQASARTLSRIPWLRSPLKIARAAVERGLYRMSELQQGILTQHALMVAWGEFADEIGLLQRLAQVSIPQKSVVHVPYGKVLSFLMGVLTGITHLKDLNEGPHPLAHDWVAIRAWGLAAMAHYTGISRTLAACDSDGDDATVRAITQVLHEVSQPFIDQEVRLLRQKGEPSIIDLDLAPRAVSNTSTTFPGAQFSWQDNEVGQGYDAALVALTCLTHGRLFLAGFHYPRNPVSLPRLQKMVRAAEERLGLRPRRRPELVQQRLDELTPTMTQRQRWLDAQSDKVKTLESQLDELPTIIAQLKTQLADLEATYREQGRKEKPYSQPAKARRRLHSAQKKLLKAPQALQRTQQAVATHRARLADLQAEGDALMTHMKQLQADDARNDDPSSIIIRVDAGFGTGPNITWLIEMGYIIYTKAYNAQVAVGLLNRLTSESIWLRVGSNAEMTAWGEHTIANCSYPLTVALERFHTPDGLKHSTLITYRDDGQCLTLPAWFDFYNARQIIEAGIKETNVVFKMHPLKMRSRGGIALQEQFSLFGANFVRWAAVWLRQRVSHSTRRFDDALERVKAMVRVAANTSAWVIAEDEGLLVRFDETGAYPDVELRLDGAWRVQPPILPQKKVQNSDFGSGFASSCT